MTPGFACRLAAIAVLFFAGGCGSTSGAQKDAGAGGAGGPTGAAGTGGNAGAGTGGAGDTGTGGGGGTGSGGTGGGGGTGGAAGGRGGAAGAGGRGGAAGAGGRGGAAGGGAGGAGGRGGSAGAGTGGAAGTPAGLRQPPIAEWPIDDAASGQTQATVRDTRPNPLPLTVVVRGATPTWAEDATGRSLNFPVGDVRYAGAYSKTLDTGDKLFDMLNGARKATIEVVADIDWRNNAAAIFHIFGVSQEDGENDDFMLWKMNDCLMFDYTGTGGYPADYHLTAVLMTAVTAGPHIFHAVLDTAQAAEADRMRIYIDGVRPPRAQFPPGLGQQPVAQNAQMAIPRPNMSWGFTGPAHYQNVSLGGYVDYYGGTGGYRGKIYYAAIHADALTDAEISSAPSRLLGKP